MNYLFMVFIRFSIEFLVRINGEYFCEIIQCNLSNFILFLFHVQLISMKKHTSIEEFLREKF